MKETRQRAEHKNPTCDYLREHNRNRSKERLLAIVAETFPSGATLITLPMNGAGETYVAWRVTMMMQDVFRALRRGVTPAPCYVWGRVSRPGAVVADYQIITNHPNVKQCDIDLLWWCGRVTVEQIQRDALLQVAHQWGEPLEASEPRRRQWAASKNVKRPSSRP